ncbi:1-acyl-sn-glycerol-3-phosphate acyltransferase [Mucilaginibacter aquatilis]|uniref:Glycerol acyltransferase n=1 Tax=Mucilaginibacter aquatilis TaxID=1517760 RepID=A0A6I4IB32_9SPHI|nr:1-acyl-sn-glycerol-3-phosphate acyltransferase [Mucilaginibacter aquatilis]MVN90716.1 glycerol acyltransferase [Mucilaginibacter aquatilis]
MIYPKKNKLITGFFHRYIGYIISRNFKAFNFNEVSIDANKSVLLLANHFGWWDGFLLYWLNHLLIKKKFHIMILEDTVRKVFFLKYMGAFSVVKNSRSMLESLQFTAELLNDPSNLVLVFPQARLYSNFIDDIHFERGLGRVIKQAAGKFQYVFAATFIEYFSHKKPSVNVYVQRHDEGIDHVDDLKPVFQQHYQQAKAQQTQIIV